MLKSMPSYGFLPGGWAPWYQKHRREVLNLAALGVSLAVAGRFAGGVPFTAAVCAFVVAALVPLRPPSGQPSQSSEFLAALPRQLASVIVTGALLHYLLSHSLDCLWFGAVWPVAAALIRLDYDRIWKWIGRQHWLLNPRRQELLRVAILAAAALWLMQGFARRSLHGGADALWYAMNLADTVAQVRSGVFPVFVGQSIYQFNGALCPIRIAPAFHYLGVLLDTLTARTLGIFELQNLLLTLLALASILTAYLGLRALLPERKWLAAALAALFLSCPGVLGIAYNDDLFMTWTTLPMVPVAWYATIRSFQDGGSTPTLVLLGSALGFCWWGHSPIALWSTFLAGAAQAVRLGAQWRGANWLGLIPGGLVFGAISAYPVGSVLFFPAEPRAHVNFFQHASAGMVVYFNHQVSPDAFLPMSATGRALSDFQLGYALWALLFLLLWTQRRHLRPISAVPAAGATLLALLLIPLPGVDLALWSLVPGFVRDVTGNWAMTRLYLPLAAATVFAAAACAATGAFDLPGRRRVLAVLVAVGCVWSFSEAAKFAAGSRQFVHPPDSAVDLLRPENIQLTRYSYSLTPDFPRHPSTFTHGVTDPALENHLLTKDLSGQAAANASSALASGRAVAAGTFRWGADGLLNHAELDRTLTIEPGKSYLLNFDFADPGQLHGVLQISGKHFFREYGLPEHGGTRAFGAGGEHATAIPLWTTSGAEELTVSFYPVSPNPPGQQGPPVARFQLVSYDRGALPVQVESWIPYRAEVQSPEPAWLETPRVFQTGYEALVDGKPAEVRKSPDSLVAVEVPRGRSSVELVYVAPKGLKFLFWLSTVSILGAASFGLWRWIIRLTTASPLPRPSQ